LFESVQKLSKPAKRKLLRKISKALELVSNDTQVQRVSEQTLEGEQISEGETTFQRVDSPPVTTTNDPTDPRSLKTKPSLHSHLTRNNTPGQLPTIINPEHSPLPHRSNRLANPEDPPIITVTQPSSTRIPLHSPNIIAYNAVQQLAEQVYYNEEKAWYPSAFLTSSHNKQHTDYDCDIEHMCAGVTHPVTGETITKYKKLVSIPEFTETWETALVKNLVIKHKAMPKLEKKGRILYLSWTMRQFNKFRKIEQSHMVELSLTIDHKKQIPTEFELLLVAISLQITLER
jgi:hypothetical protein